MQGRAGYFDSLRIYFFAVHYESYGLTTAQGQSLVEKALSIAAQLATEEHTPLAQFLLDPGHSLLVAERKKLQDKIDSRNEPSISTSGVKKEGNCNWRAEHEKVFKNKGLSWKASSLGEVQSPKPTTHHHHPPPQSGQSCFFAIARIFRSVGGSANGPLLEPQRSVSPKELAQTSHFTSVQCRVSMDEARTAESTSLELMWSKLRFVFCSSLVFDPRHACVIACASPAVAQARRRHGEERMVPEHVQARAGGLDVPPEDPRLQQEGAMTQLFFIRNKDGSCPALFGHPVPASQKLGSRRCSLAFGTPHKASRLQS